MEWLMLVGLSLLSGYLGRLGGAEGHNKLYRRVGCSVIAVLAFCILFGWCLKDWWVYLIMFGLHWGAFSTYWDRIFQYDHLWVSGFVVGLALLPALLINPSLLLFILVRAIILAVFWGCLNRFLPQKVLLWRRDVAEEFLRYAISF